MKVHPHISGVTGPTTPQNFPQLPTKEEVKEERRRFGVFNGGNPAPGVDSMCLVLVWKWVEGGNVTWQIRTVKTWRQSGEGKKFDCYDSLAL